MDANDFADFLGITRRVTTHEDIKRMWNALRERNHQIQHERGLNALVENSFRKGSRVSFTGRYGMPATGTIKALNRTTATVADDSGPMWRIPFASLHPEKTKAKSKRR